MFPHATRLAALRYLSLAAQANDLPQVDADYPLSLARNLLPVRGMTLGRRESRGLFSSVRRALGGAWLICARKPSRNATQESTATLTRARNLTWAVRSSERNRPDPLGPADGLSFVFLS